MLITSVKKDKNIAKRQIILNQVLKANDKFDIKSLLL